MTTTPYTLYHGTSNDFAVVDAANHVPDRTAFARHVCADLGVDGVLFLARDESENPEESPARCTMTLVQPDGSTAAMCGNGARCAARWVAEQTGHNEVLLDTPAGTRRSTVDGDHVVVEMGVPSYDPDDVPVVGDEPMDGDVLNGYAITAVNTGVPHAVAFVDDVDSVDLEADAPPIRNHERFPEGANATFAEETDTGFRQRTFERGVEGETQSCGTGAVAIAAVAARHGRIPGDATVTVAPPGGELEVSVTPGGSATLAGPTERVREGEAETEPHVPNR